MSIICLETKCISLKGTRNKNQNIGERKLRFENESWISGCLYWSLRKW